MIGSAKLIAKLEAIIQDLRVANNDLSSQLERERASFMAEREKLLDKIVAMASPMALAASRPRVPMPPREKPEQPARAHWPSGDFGMKSTPPLTNEPS